MARSTRAAQPDDAPAAEQPAEPAAVADRPAAPVPVVDEFEARAAVVAAALNGGRPLYAVSIGGTTDA